MPSIHTMQSHNDVGQDVDKMQSLYVDLLNAMHKVAIPSPPCTSSPKTTSSVSSPQCSYIEKRISTPASGGVGSNGGQQRGRDMGSLLPSPSRTEFRTLVQQCADQDYWEESPSPPSIPGSGIGPPLPSMSRTEFETIVQQCADQDYWEESPPSPSILRSGIQCADQDHWEESPPSPSILRSGMGPLSPSTARTESETLVQQCADQDYWEERAVLDSLVQQCAGLDSDREKSPPSPPPLRSGMSRALPPRRSYLEQRSERTSTPESESSPESSLSGGVGSDKERQRGRYMGSPLPSTSRAMFETLVQQYTNPDDWEEYPPSPSAHGPGMSLASSPQCPYMEQQSARTSISASRVSLEPSPHNRAGSDKGQRKCHNTDFPMPSMRRSRAIFNAIVQQCTDLHEAMHGTSDCEEGGGPHDDDGEFQPEVDHQPVERSPHGHHENDHSDPVPRDHIARCALARPSIWARAYTNIPTLASGVWVDATILDFYLLTIWYSTRGRTHVRFVDTVSAKLSYDGNLGTHQAPTEEEIRLFQQRYFFEPAELPDASQPIAFIAHDHQHYFAVVFNYATAVAYVLGRRIGEGCEELDEELDDWETWMGPFYWDRLAALHGIDPGDSRQILVISHNWPQNGSDCGPIACFLVKHFMDAGLGESDGEVYFPPIPCGHHLRWQMLGVVREACRTSWEGYNLLTSTHLPEDDIWRVWDDTEFVENEELTAMEDEASGQQYAPVVRDLNIACTNCISCQRDQWNCASMNLDFSDDEAPQDEDEEDDNHEARGTSKAKRLRQLFRRYPDTKRARQRDMIPARAVNGRSKRDESDIQANQPKSVKNWSEATMFRFRRPTAPISFPAHVGPKWLPFDRNFDHYEGAPIYESMHSYRNSYEIVVEPYCRQGIWSMFRDYGWRTLPSFHQMFYLGNPTGVLDHIMMVGVPADYDPAKQISDHVTGDYSLRRLLSSGNNGSDSVDVTDVTICGPAEMLKLGPKESKPSFDAFVRGRIGDKHICVNLERDHVPLDSADIDVSADIDSLIWVTRQPRFRKSVSISLGPILDKQAPIKKHNHVYIEILVPQSEEDADSLGERTDWWTVPFALSSIPHTSFGNAGGGAGGIEIYIFFPRMIHRDQPSGYRATNIPKEIQDHFWEHVLLPSIRCNVDGVEAVYADLTLPEVKYKSRKDGRHRRKPGRPKAIPFSPTAFGDIIETMRSIIRRDPERLTLYGSFFFVVEAKGIKLWTKTAAPLESLLLEFPALDWEYMTDQRYGELVVDIGVTFHPNWEEPLVGLWRLEQLEASFGASGFTRGNAHHACTLGRYGGIQAEMSQERTRRTQICFRSSYNLAYEVVRPNDNSPTSFTDKDAYACNQDFMKECNLAIDMYEGKAKERSYGVRDEYRMSGTAATQLLDNLAMLGERYLKSHPILWISSATWFNFLARRLRELQLVQIKLRRLEPPNLGVLTGIICTMIHSISSTPIILDSHVRESMALLRFCQTCERSGMFFLFDLDLDNIPCLPEVQAVDDMDVLRRTKGRIGDRQGKKKASWPAIHATYDHDIFPIGDRPTWEAVVKAIGDRPWDLMRAWTWDVRLRDIQPVLAKLFTDFTSQMWLYLHTEWLINPTAVPAPTTLEEAMECWTVQRVYAVLTACAFEACNTGLPGHLPKGRPQTSFSGRASTFFPLAENPYHPKSPWNAFRTSPGYLYQFHQLMEDLDEAEQFDFVASLREIFSCLHCLPSAIPSSKSVVGKPWVISNQQKVRFVTNPLFYKILGLGDGHKAATPRRTGPHATKPLVEFALDIYRAAGYDEMVARQQIAMKRQILRRAKKRMSTKTKRARKPPPGKKRNPTLSHKPTPDTPTCDGDRGLMKELFGEGEEYEEGDDGDDDDVEMGEIDISSDQGDESD